MIGSLARFSTITNTTVPTAASAKSPMICHDPQGYSWPPSVSPRSRGTIPTRSITEPSQSMLTLRSSFGFRGGIWKMMNARATSPTGMLT